MIGPHGDQSVAIGGTAFDTTLFGEAEIQSGGTAIGMTVKSGGLLGVADGGSASGVVSSGGALALFGSNPSVAGVTLLTGAILELGDGHVGSGDVSRGFPEKVIDGGTQAGGAILSGGRVDVLFLGIVSGTTVSSGGRIVVSNAGKAIDVTIDHGGTGIVSSGGMFLADAGGTAEIDGRLTLNTAGELFASGAGGLIDIASGGFVSGGSAVIGDGTVAIHASGNTEKVVFQPDGSGGLILDDRAGHATAYAGRVSGFGGVSHTNTSQFIDLESVTFSAGKIGSSYTPINASSGTLTVTSGGTVVAKIAFAGEYVASDFHVTSDGAGHVLITDPGVPFGGGATLGFAADGTRHGGTLPITPGTAATAALFGHYIAGSLVAGAGAYGDGLTVEAAASAGQHPHLTPPHG
jgi:autotransporter passenger strand-loop-strand repeat protein